MSHVTAQFLAFTFYRPHIKPHRVRGLSKHYLLRLDPKLVRGTGAIGLIPCDCIECATMLDKPWAYGIDHTKEPCYQPV